MRAADIVGSRVLRVVQAALTVDGRRRHSVEEIHFDNGKVLVLAALEGPDEPWVHGRVHPGEAGQKGGEG